MTREQAEAILCRPALIRRQIKNLDEEIERLEASLLPKGLSQGDCGGKGSGFSDPFARFAAEYADLAQERDLLYEEYKKADAQFDSLVSCLPPEGKSMMDQRYRQRHSNRRIAYELAVSRRHVQRLFENFFTQISQKGLMSPLDSGIM